MTGCAHPACGCEEAPLNEGERAYCSEDCAERHAMRPVAACGCGHPECATAGHESGGPPRRV